jgi:hypothetical protein
MRYPGSYEPRPSTVATGLRDRDLWTPTTSPLLVWLNRTHIDTLAAKLALAKSGRSIGSTRSCVTSQAHLAE